MLRDDNNLNIFRISETQWLYQREDFFLCDFVTNCWIGNRKPLEICILHLWCDIYFTLNLSFSKESGSNRMINHATNIFCEPNSDSQQLWYIIKAEHNEWKFQCQNYNSKSNTDPTQNHFRIYGIINNL